jgi:hypothetical protein
LGTLLVYQQPPSLQQSNRDSPSPWLLAAVALAALLVGLAASVSC